MSKSINHHIFAFAVAFAILSLAGCTTTSSKIQPAPQAIHDTKTPVALSKPSISQRLKAQRIQDGQVAQGKIAVGGSIVR